MSTKSKFIDHARIFVRAGSGGDGHIGFHRAKFIPKGGPNGGDGGRGGDLVFVGSTHQSTLQDFQFVRHFEADDGEKGGRDQCHGKNGKDKEIPVPLGTVILDDESRETLGEITTHNQRLVLEEGGKGGLGNVHFKSSTHQAPRIATP